MRFTPIIPFEPVSSDKIPEGKDWVSQIKWDGVRILTYFDGHSVKLFNRKRNERTITYPELTDIKAFSAASSFIIDGEVIALDKDGKPSFHTVMQRDRLMHPDKIKEAIHTNPIFYMIFDVIFCNSKWIHERSLLDRMDLLSKMIKPTEKVQLVSAQKDGLPLFDVVKQHGLEGIVTKNINSGYFIGGKNANWQKIKNYYDVIAVVGGVTYRSGIVNSLLLGLFNERNQLCYIGSAGTGKLTDDEWKAFTRGIEPLKTMKTPFSNQPERKNKVQWLKPVITVKIQYIEWRNGHSLRQPSIQAFVDQPAALCKLSDLIVKHKNT
ncbi:DNA ligase [Bacillaceae bacterium Marseille-Q3522]|nr:DNA ligase [Bacillaceae bacterium Marseille-Q3522]